VLIQLASLLRAALDSARRPEHSLREELELARRFLEIERVRLAGRLRFEVDAERDALDLLVPTLILQPLVENAVRHGIAPRPGPGVVRIEARRRSDGLHLAVVDDGVGFDGVGWTPGIGLDNTRRRLAHVYGDDCGFEAAGAVGEGVEVRLRIPARASPGELVRNAGQTATYHNGRGMEVRPACPSEP
jgi:sensor histidine kinase YesM